MTLRQTLYATLAALTMAMAVPAHAGKDAPVEGLAWNWQDKSLRYHINGSVYVPDWVWLRALNNLEVRVNEIYVEMVSTCAPRGPGKKTWEVRCTIDAIGIQAAPLPRDAKKAGKEVGQLDRILEEWTERLTGTDIQMQWGMNGKIRSITLPDLKRLNRRDGENIEILRQVMVRAFSPLEISLPKNGRTGPDRVWSEKEPLIAGFLSNQGSVGNVPTQHTIDAQRDGQVRIQTQGQGTITNAARQRAVAGNKEFTDFFEIEFTTETFFDTAVGHMVRREVVFGGTPTASSVIADGMAGLPYLQTYRVQLIPADVDPPHVMASKEVSSSIRGQPSAINQP